MCFGRIILPIETNESTIGTQLCTNEKLSDFYKDNPVNVNRLL